MPYLIDGHNLLFAICGDDERFGPVDPRELCGLLDRYLAANGEWGCLVFDGTGPVNKTVYRRLCHLEVVFSGPTIEADEIIEGRLERETLPQKLVVVSNDRRVRRAAQRNHCVFVAVDRFWESVLEYLRRKRVKPEPMGKRHGLNDKETDGWMRAFGLEDN